MKIMTSKKILAGLLALTLTFSAIPEAAVSAAESVPIPEQSSVKNAEGEWQCGKNAYLTISGSTARIWGTGTTYSYDDPATRPWASVLSEIETVIIEDGITHLNSNIFKEAVNLNKIVFSDSVVSIGFSAFIQCYSLKTVTIPKSVKNIASGAFYSTGLEELNYAGTEEEWAAVKIKENAFSNDSLVINFGISSGSCGENARWSIADGGVLHIDGTGAVASYERGAAPWYSEREQITEIVLADGITAVGDYAFADLTNVAALPTDGLTAIGEGAFIGCTGAAEVVISDSVASIGENAFGEAGERTLYVVPGSAGEGYAAAAGISYEAVAGICGKSSGYKITESEISGQSVLTIVGSGDIYSYTDDELSVRPWDSISGTIRRVVISDGIRSVGRNDFYSLPQLHDISLGKGLKRIDSQAFADCAALEWAVFPEGIEDINSYAFYADHGLQYLVFPKSLAFSQTTSLYTENAPAVKGVYYAGSVGEYSDISDEVYNEYAVNKGLLKFGCTSGQCGETAYWAYDPAERCLQVFGSGSIENAPWGDYAAEAERIVISDGIDHIGDSVFSSFTAVNSLSLGSGIRTIGNGSFSGCTSLKAVVFNEALEEIGSSAFEGCTSLGEINITENVKRIGSSAFKGCTSVYHADVPEGLLSIGASAFEGCGELDEVYISSFSTELDERALGYLSENRTYADFVIITFEGTPAAEYAEANGIRVIIADGVCGDNAVYTFDEDTGTFSVYGWGATYSYNNSDEGKAPWAKAEGDSEPVTGRIKKLVFDNRITEIGSNFMTGASELETVLLPESLKKLGTSAFSSCVSLQYLSVPDGLEEIGVNCLDRCDNINTLIFNGSMPEIFGAINEAGKRITNTSSIKFYYHYSDQSWAALSSYNGTGTPDSSVTRNPLGLRDDTRYYDLDTASTSQRIVIHDPPERISIGDPVKLDIELDPRISTSFVWESSDPSVIQVSGEGVVTAYSEGEASVTVRSAMDDSIYTSIPITSEDTHSYLTLQPQSFTLDGYISSNISANYYDDPAAHRITSYFVQKEDGSYSRVEKYGENVLIEDYSRDFEMTGSRVIENPLQYFIGFYQGSTYNYLVFSQENPDEDDTKEIIRVVRYNKDWTEPKSCQISDIGATDVSLKFARMTESEDLLYIITSRTEYRSIYPEGEAVHQGNLIFAINKETMERDTRGIGAIVSHSFNQFIAVDSSYVYTADHGDFSPRSIVEHRFARNVSSTTNVREADAFPIIIIGTGKHKNDTGVSIGGLEATGSGSLMVGNSAKQDPAYSSQGIRDVFVTVSDPAFKDMRTIWLTNYYSRDPSDGVEEKTRISELDGLLEIVGDVTTRTPQLVKVNDNIYAVMWEEEERYNGEIKNITTKLVIIDQYGSPLTEIQTTDMRLSDCQPIISDDGYITWYVTNNSVPVVYRISPYTCVPIITNVIDYSDFDEKTGTLTIRGTGNIPAVVDGERPYTQNTEDIKRIVIEGDVYSIGKNAFSGLENLEEVYIKSTTYSIEDGAFSNNAKLETIVLPETINSLGSGVVSGDGSLKEIILPESIQSADWYGLYTGTSADIIYTGTEEKWEELTADVNEQIKGIKDVSTSAQTGSCGELAYWVYDPESKTLEVFGTGEIDQCDEGKYPWSDLADSVENLELDGSFTKLPDHAFEDFTLLETPVIPKTVTSIGLQTFAGSITDGSIVITDSITEIGDYAIGYDTDLSPREDFQIYGSDGSAAQAYAESNGISFTAVDGYCGDGLGYVFDEETGVLTIYGSGDMYDYSSESPQPWKEFANEIKEIELPEGITSIGDFAFNGLSSLTSVTIPESVTNIGEQSFSNNMSLREININSVEHTQEFAAFFNTYGIDRTINYAGTAEQWKQVAEDNTVSANDTLVFEVYTSPGTTTTAAETTVTTTQTTAATETTAASDTTSESTTMTTAVSTDLITTAATTSETSTTQTTEDIVTSGTVTAATTSSTLNTETTETTAATQTDISTQTTTAAQTAETATSAASDTETTDTDTTATTAGGTEADTTTETASTSGTVTTAVTVTTEPVTTTQPVTTTEPDGYLLGDFNLDGTVDANDASELLSFYAQLSTGGIAEVTELQYLVGDINRDELIDSGDATLILQYYAYVSTGGSLISNEYFADYIRDSEK